MPNPWDAEIPIDLELAKNLIQSQFKEFKDQKIEPFAQGWDNEAFLVGAEIVFRFPRRKIAANLIEREIRILPILAPHLPTRITKSEWLGKETSAYPFVWAGYRKIEGAPAILHTLKGRAGEALADSLASFLRNLHSIPVDEPTRAWAPGDEIERTNLKRRLPKLIERLERLPDVDAEKLIRIAEELSLTEPSSHAPVWVHGDLHPSHVLVDEGRLSGVIDWGDVHLGDHALDLSIAYTLLDRDLSERFFQTYGPVDDDTLARAQFRALHYGPILLEYGLAEGKEEFVKAGRSALRTIAGL